MYSTSGGISEDFEQTGPNNDAAEDGKIKFDLAGALPKDETADYSYMIKVTADGGSLLSDQLTFRVVCGSATITIPELQQEIIHEIDGE